MTIATTEDQRDAQQSIRAWAASAEPIPTLRGDEQSGWRTLWPALGKLGLFSVAAAESVGGVGGTVADLAAMIEAAAAALVSGPVLSTALAAIVTGDRAEDFCEGRVPCAVMLSGEPVDAVRDGEFLVLDGVVELAMGGADGVALMLPACIDGETVWCVVDADSPGTKVEQIVGVDRSLPLARITLDGVRASPLPGVTSRYVHDLSATLAAADAAGIAGWCLHAAVEHAKFREQFGSPIGSFQAIKHLCAEMLCRTEKARAAAWDAAVAADLASEEFSLSAAVAASIALDAAVDNAKDCIQVLGGIGFTWEHDAHLYLRRALALRQILGGSPAWRVRVADRARAGVRRTLHVDLGAAEDLRAQTRDEVCRIAEAEDCRTALADSGLAAPHWPSPHGRDAGPAEQLLYAQELARAGVETPDLVIGWWAVPTILEHGTPEQIEKFAGPTLRGEVAWCQLFSEPEAGSDLASLRTAAKKVDGGWTLQGHKVWTSLAREADWAICLARTDRDVAKHKGISYFLLDMQTPGIRIEPLREITGDAVFNEVFLDDVFVPDDCLVGQENNGWKLARTTLANERVAMSNGSSLGTVLEDAIEATAQDQAVTERLGGLIADGLVGSLLGFRATLRRLGGQDPGAESSVRKLVGVRHRQDLAEFALDAAGPLGAAEGPLAKEMLLTRCLSIAGGTTQILLTVAAERILGLPR
ncbi:acyl-CoA dehydrogenase family protein [Rhodococcus sp. G-MC3]|uniref:acyl-CoA dehydrogenase family protein n=1 Tax=Rhodococcus sp. G-MC3 TaxID=3046209 RepID=UPI0024BAA6A6|nr:acyl-CoA dehydrogenase family protein [Rhodococcus sp. G-MC3]MDJ0393394.1 acyl-CoA dehydrogenase family protein [Rhodococcus sp. G-MC3]